jgi:hypothetical protein
VSRFYNTVCAVVAVGIAVGVVAVLAATYWTHPGTERLS